MITFTHCKRRKKKKLRLILDEWSPLSQLTLEQSQQCARALAQMRDIVSCRARPWWMDKDEEQPEQQD